MTRENSCPGCKDPHHTHGHEPAPNHGRRVAAEAAASPDERVRRARMSRIAHKIMVLSGKGGVGKSTVAVNLATALAMAGKRVGLLDVDIHGPSVPKLLHVDGRPVTGSDGALHPVEVEVSDGRLAVMSIGFLLRDRDDAVIWRGPRKYGVIKQFLEEVEWGELDYLVIDAPPGTGDEPLAVAELIPDPDGAVVVTTPQEISVQDVRRCVVFCRQVGVPVIGVVENMSGFTCPSCGDVVPIFGADGGRAMAEQMDVPFLGAIPIEPEVVVSGDGGTPMVKAKPHSQTAMAFGRLVRTLLEPELAARKRETEAGSAEAGAGEGPAAGASGRPMRIAVPVTGGVLSSHFGHCEEFVLFDVVPGGPDIGGRRVLTPPPHEPGTFPRWLHEQGATVIIAGGMGSRAMSLFDQNGIAVVTGATSGAPDALVRDFLAGSLATGANVCDH